MKFKETRIMKDIVKNHIIEKRLKHKKQRGDYFYASEGYLPHNKKDSKCGRQLGYKILGYEKDEERTDMYPIFALGDLYHDFIQKIFVEEGIARQVEQADIVYDDDGRYFYIKKNDNKLIITDPVEIHGRLDLWFFMDGEYLADIKTISEKGWYFIEDKPKETHYAQLQIYLHEMKEEGIDEGFILYINKSTGEMREFLVEYDEEYILETLENYRKLYDYIKNKGLPPRHFKSGGEVPWQCKYCAFTKKCLGLPLDVVKEKNFLSYPKDEEKEEESVGELADEMMETFDW